MELKVICKRLITQNLDGNVTEGEYGADIVGITAPRFYGNHDLSEFSFRLSAISEENGSIAEQVLTKDIIDEENVHLLWEVTSDFTVSSGEVTLILAAVNADNNVQVKFISQPVTINDDRRIEFLESPTILEQAYNQVQLEVQKSIDAAERAEKAALNPVLPVASENVLGGVRIDNSTIKITDDGVISAQLVPVDSGIMLSGKAAYSVSGTVEYPLLALKIEGKSTQNGTPSAENPVDIINVGDGGFDLIIQGEKVMSGICWRTAGRIITKQPASAIVKIDDTATFTVDGGTTYQWQQNTGTSWNDISTAAGRSKSISIGGATFRNGYRYRCIVSDSGGNSEISNNVTLYVVSKDYNIISGSMAALNGAELCSVGDVHDKLIYNVNGTSRIVKRTAKIDSYSGESVTGAYISSTGGLDIGAEIIYVLDTPQEIGISAAEAADMIKLQTYSGMTSITNTAGVETDIKICTNADYSEYIYSVIKGLINIG